MAGAWSLVAICFAWPGVLEGADRYAAWLADGRRITAQQLPTWPLPGAPFRFEKHDLLAAQNPARLVRDLQAEVELRPPFLLLANGDIVTGIATQLAPDEGRRGQIPRVQVQLEGLLPLSGTQVEVRTDRVARIVGSAAAMRRQSPEPGTVELANGRRLVARSIQWREYGLALLTPEGIVEANYAEIVDAVLPEVDRMAAVLDDHWWAGGTSAGTILRLQLTGGAIVTTARISREQLRSRRRNRSLEVSHFYYVQPAWSDQPLAIAEREIAWCGYRPADRAPLALLPREVLTSRSLLGTTAKEVASANADENIASGLWESDVGIRTHAYSELAIDLPAGAKSLQTAVGLDRSVGDGGCVRCSIVADKVGGRELWNSGIVLGLDGPRASGSIDVAGIARVVLITDVAHEDRPAGADPLDIRDRAVWLAPLVQMDWTGRESQRLLSILAGLESWKLAGNEWLKVQVANRWNANSATWDPTLLVPQKMQLRLTRKVWVTPAGDVVEMATAYPLDLEEHDLRLRVNGEEVEFCTSVEYDQLKATIKANKSRRQRDDESLWSDQLAYWWDLKRWRGQEVELELTIRGAAERNEIAWRGLSLRSAIGNLPESGQPLSFDVPLTSLEPLDLTATNAGGAALKDGLPTKDHLPAGRGTRPIRFLGQSFTNGYGLRGNSSISFPLRAEYRTFVAVAGCSEKMVGPLQVLIDGQVVWQRNLVDVLMPAEQLEITLPAGASTLTLKTGSEGPYYSYAAWANAGFVTQP
ncbi:MAG: NPCBM/NEW2 domain-containing protein [Pirellulaceae bacterium]